MAKIYEEVVVIKLSTLVKDHAETAHGSLASKETLAALEQVAQELVDKSVVVEIELAK
jgi:hypothetical protein